MNHSANEEIDILELLISAFRFLISHGKALIMSSLAGGVLLGSLTFVLPKVYKSEMILQSDILTSSFSERITESINRLIKEKNYGLISSRFNISIEQAEHVVNLEIESVKTTKSEKDEEQVTFIVTLEVDDPTLVPLLQQQIIEYLRNNEFVKIRVSQRIDLYNKMIAKTQNEIKSLDSLRNRLFSGQRIINKSNDLFLLDPTNIYSKILDLNKQVIDYQHALELSQSIQLIEGFTTFSKPAKPKPIILFIAGIFMGLFACLAGLSIQWLVRKSKEPS